MSKLSHPALYKLLRLAYSAERAAAFAYIGHAGSLKHTEEKAAVKRIEDDEWEHRASVLKIMQQYDIPISRYYEIRFYLIGRFISFSCYFIGRFMPYYFAGRLESGNTCEYIHMMRYFHELHITEHDQLLYDMAVKEKEHEIYFLDQVRSHFCLRIFEGLFRWGRKRQYNDIDLTSLKSVERSLEYCQK